MARMTLWDERDDPRGSLLSPSDNDVTRTDEPHRDVTDYDVRSARFPIPWSRSHSWQLVLHSHCASALTRMDGWALEDWDMSIDLTMTG